MPVVSLSTFVSFSSLICTVFDIPTAQEIAFLVLSLELHARWLTHQPASVACPTRCCRRNCSARVLSCLYLAANIQQQNWWHSFPLPRLIQNDWLVKNVTGEASTNGMIMAPRTFAKEKQCDLVCCYCSLERRMTARMWQVRGHNFLAQLEQGNSSETIFHRYRFYIFINDAEYQDWSGEFQ